MIVSNTNSICEQARIYYYDYVCEKQQECVPVEMLSHIGECHHCLVEIGRLETVLTESEGLDTANSAIITNLKLHFAHIGTSVTCVTVKPFLPSFSDPLLEVRVPTPITVHLDKCEQCANDLETIRQLNLSHKQLCRLGQLFAERYTADTVVCAKAQNIVSSVVSITFHKTDVETLKHFCCCPACRKLVYQHREMVYEKLQHNNIVQKDSSCEGISLSAFFDYCFPYGIDHYIEFHTVFTSHVSKCPQCLRKMNELHRMVYDILERTDSGITTRFTMSDETIENSVASSSDDIYED